MKILIRIFTFTIISILLLMSLMKLSNIVTIENELNNASALAMENTQRIMKDIVIDREFDVDKNRNTYFIDENGKNLTYEKYYINSFLDNVKDRKIYDINVNANEDYGIIYVEIKNTYSKLIPTKKLLNIIEIEE